MCEKCCQCGWKAGQSVVVEMSEHGLICLKCGKILVWIDQDQDDDDDQDQGVQLQPDPRTLDQITVDIEIIGGDPGLYGQAVFVCEHCKTWLHWKGTKERLQEMVEDMRIHDAICCPHCNMINEITDEVREMLK